MGWAEVSPNPNSPEVLEVRQAALDRAWRSPPGQDRFAYIEAHCGDRLVLDVGCTGHGGEMASGGSLHARIRQVAAECIGIDYNTDSVAAWRQQGFDVRRFDIVRDDARLLGVRRYDVVVAGSSAAAASSSSHIRLT